ncbi:MAG: SUMF1/EgtB/PvdO family nonheme iron enzyme [Thermogemmata sp.]|nr:SUMF1/EgtB/PvdO family nonheme iron enzyme [Thermogemmata sp.]
MEHWQPEPHEQVLLMQANRIGAACLPYIYDELYCRQGQPLEAVANRCRGAIAVLQRMYTADGQTCWLTKPRESDLIADWLSQHLNRLIEVEREQKNPNTVYDHRLAEAVKALAALIASSQSLPLRPSLTSRGAYHDPERAKKFRENLRHLFTQAPKRPTLLLACCDAAEQLGTPEDLQLLDQQTRRLDVQANFKIQEVDRILETRDRVLAREPLRSELLKKSLERIEKLGLTRLAAPDKNTLLFSRPSDGAVMALIQGGSFIRGDNHYEESQPQRRIHLNSYLIDVEPVSQQSFTRWIEQQGAIMRVERGFFPVQGLPENIQHESPYALYVTWFAAQAYAQWAISGGHLPTEAQWEKAARGTADTRRYPSGDTWRDEATSPFGVHICHILEWTLDAYDRWAYQHNPAVFDPFMQSTSQAGDEALRVVRGRRPDTPVGDYSLVRRLGMEPITGAFTAPVGFRVVVELEQESPL